MAEANAIAAHLRGKGLPTRTRRGPNGKPTVRNLEVLAFMRAFFEENDQLPPVAQIARHFGWALNAADSHIANLLRHGLVERNATGKLRFARPKKEENQ